jgi:acyl-coenzyme A thioesterase 13
MNSALELLLSQLGRDARHSPSPVMRWLNPILLQAAEGALELKYTVRPEWLNPVGILHGGISAAMVDDAIGATIYSLGDTHFYVTLNNYIDYFAPAKEGEVVIAVTGITRRGKTLVAAWCELWNADRTTLLVKGSSNLLKTAQAKS